MLLTSAAMILIYIYESGGSSLMGELRKQFGSKAYSNIYKLATEGYVIVRDREIVLTDRGKVVAECLARCKLP